MDWKQVCSYLVAKFYWVFEILRVQKYNPIISIIYTMSIIFEDTYRFIIWPRWRYIQSGCCFCSRLKMYWWIWHMTIDGTWIHLFTAESKRSSYECVAKIKYHQKGILYSFIVPKIEIVHMLKKILFSRQSTVERGTIIPGM